MKAEFDFPLFSDLQLGPYGFPDGVGCLMAKKRECIRAAGMTHDEEEDFEQKLMSNCGGAKAYFKLTGICRDDNTVANRRKGYGALEKTIRELGYTIAA